MSEQDMERRSVLVADDEPAIIRMVKRVLRQDYRIIEAENGVQAVKLARELQPDIILLDMMMPEMDGLTACAELKKDALTKSIPVIMITGIGFDLNAKLAGSMGADGYVVKPFKPKELLDVIASLLER